MSGHLKLVIPTVPYKNQSRRNTRSSYTLLSVFLLASIFASTSATSAAYCTLSSSDTDNDGWGWENGASCVVNQQPATPVIATTAVVQGSERPVCTLATSDPDNDGWGWEFGQSCVTINPAIANPTIAATPTATTGTPTCSSADLDDNNDGWGWENNASCVVSANANNVASASAATTTTTNSISNDGPPECIAASSDHDNDGWGWENNASCVVTSSSSNTAPGGNLSTASATQTPTAVPVCSRSVIDENSDGWAWENNQSCSMPPALVHPLKVMAVGDSITHGVRGQTSYRLPLNTLLTQAGCGYQFVGSQASNYQHNGFNSPHESYTGHTADQFLTGHTDHAGANAGITQSMQSFDPNVVLLHIGTNDMRLGQSIDTTLSEIDQIIAAIHQHNPSAIVFVANVIPWYLAAQPQVQALGDRIEAYVAQLANSQVRLVDVRTGYTPAMMISDQAHPNATGDTHIANAFFNAYNSAGICN